MRGDVKAGPLWAWQGVGLVHTKQSAREIVTQLVAEAREALSGNPTEPSSSVRQVDMP